MHQGVAMHTDYSCRTCKRTDLAIEQMKKYKFLLTRKKGICKPCHSNYTKINTRIKKAEKSPEDTFSCNCCDSVFSKYQTGSSTQKNGNKKLRTYCPFCKSEEIDRF